MCALVEMTCVCVCQLGLYVCVSSRVEILKTNTRIFIHRGRKRGRGREAG